MFWAVLLSANAVVVRWAGPGRARTVPIRPPALDQPVALRADAAVRARPLRLGSTAPPPDWTALIPLGLVIGGLCVNFYVPPAEYIIGGKDPGIYMNEGIRIAQRGALIAADEVVRSVPPPFRGLFFRPSTDPSYYSNRFMGFFLLDSAATTVVGQFPHLYPLWIAIAYGLNGLSGAREVVGVWAVLGLLAVYFVGARLVGRAAALTGALLLAVNVVQVWYARYPNAEMLMQPLVFAGLLAFTRAEVDEDRFFAPVAALLLDPLPVHTSDRRARRGLRRRDGSIGVGPRRTSPNFVLSASDARHVPGRGVPAALHPALLRRPAWIHPEPSADPHRVCRPARHHRRGAVVRGPSRAGCHSPALDARSPDSCRVGLRSLRPLLSLGGRRTRGARRGQSADLHGVLPVAGTVWRLPSSGLRWSPRRSRKGRHSSSRLRCSLSSSSTRSESSQSTSGRLAAFWRSFCPARCCWLAPQRSGNRRSADKAVRADGSVECASPVISRGSRWSCCSAGISGARRGRYSVTSSTPGSSLTSNSLRPRSATTTSSWSSREARRTLTCWRCRWLTSTRATSSSSPTTNPDKAVFREFLIWARGRYRRVFFAGGGGGGTELLSRQMSVVPVRGERFQVPEYESPVNAYPRGVRFKEFDLSIYEFLPQPAVAEGFDLDVGAADDIYVRHFYAKEQRPAGFTFRWTRDVSFVSIVGTRPEQQRLTLWMSAGGRPPGAAPATVEVFLDDLALGSLTVGRELAQYRSDHPSRSGLVDRSNRRGRPIAACHQHLESRADHACQG